MKSNTKGHKKRSLGLALRPDSNETVPKTVKLTQRMLFAKEVVPSATKRGGAGQATSRKKDAGMRNPGHPFP
jgi:hypothetical protein